MSEARIYETKSGSSLFLELRGDFNEDYEYPPLDLNEVSEVIIDAGSVSSMNSIGIHNWNDWIQRIPKEIAIAYRNCSHAFVNNLCLISSMTPENAKVESIYIPYTCMKCKKQTQLFFNVEHLSMSKELKVPSEVEEEINCKKCGGTAEIDVLPRLYFSFTRRSSN